MDYKLDARIVIRLSADDAYVLKDVATTLGLTVSQVVRMLLKSKDTLRSMERKVNKLPL